ASECAEASHENGYIRPGNEHSVGMPELVESINCPKCGGPLTLAPGEVIVTCPYCGTVSRFQGDKAFVLRHSMLSARIDRDGAVPTIQGWIEDGVMKPDDRRKTSRIATMECINLPSYVFEVDAPTTYPGGHSLTGPTEGWSAATSRRRAEVSESS